MILDSQESIANPWIKKNKPVPLAQPTMTFLVAIGRDSENDERFF